VNIDEFHEQLRKTGCYETRKVPGWALRRLALRTDAAYCSEIVRSVFIASLNCMAGRFDDRRWAKTSWRALQRVETAGSRVEITGYENLLRAGGPAVVVGNHMSILETFVLPSILMGVGPLAFVVKESLIRYPFFGRILRTVGCVTVGRENPRDDFEAVMRDGEAMLKAGRFVVVFPQSTRSFTVVPEQFSSIGVKLARRVGVPVVPLALKTDFQRLGRILKDVGRVDRGKPVRFKFAPGLPPGDNPKAIHESCVKFIASTVGGWSVQTADGAGRNYV
jgi:1-acyl-sn-glycerol-3-phosphate acyltransferase